MKERKRTPTLLLILDLALAAAPAASARSLAAQDSKASPDPSCVNTEAGQRVISGQDSTPVYPSPCKDSLLGTGNTGAEPAVTIQKCEPFLYLGVKAVSNCGDSYCYREVTTGSGHTGWIVDHTLGKSDSNITGVDSSACALVKDPTCVDTEAGVRMLTGGAVAAVYPSPCGNGLPVGSLGNCTAFQYTGHKATSTCGGGACFREVKLAEGTRGWILDHPLGSKTSNVTSVDDPACAGTDSTPPPDSSPSQEVEAKRTAVMAEVQTALKDEASTAAYFEAWMTKWGTHYSVGSPEYVKREAIFKQNIETVLHLNEGATTWWAEVNAFADLEEEEFEERYLGAKLVRPTPKEPEMIERRRLRGVQHGATAPVSTKLGHRRRALESPPDFKDWEAEGKVSPVGDQQSCGSCWAFSALSAIESKYLISNGQQWALSVQELVDCLAHQCGGGDPAAALEYVYDYGVLTEAAYPWTGATTGICNTTCMNNPTPADRAYLKDPLGFQFVAPFSASDLMQAVSRQPTVVGMNVANDVRNYGGGIFAPSQCLHTNNIEDLNHVMLVVGYNATGGIGAPGTYWKLKNSWGAATWGLSGYMLMPMEKDSDRGACGMYTYMVHPTEVGKSIGGNGQEGEKTFNWPRYNGIPLDWCLDWTGECGQEAARHFCEMQGFNIAKEFGGPVAIGKEVFAATVLPKTGALCSPYYHECQTFSYITCGWQG